MFILQNLSGIRYIIPLDWSLCCLCRPLEAAQQHNKHQPDISQVILERLIHEVFLKVCIKQCRRSMFSSWRENNLVFARGCLKHPYYYSVFLLSNACHSLCEFL